MTAAYKKYAVVSSKTGELVKGPYATRKRCKRVIEKEGLSDVEIKVVRDEIEKEVESNDAKVEAKKPKVGKVVGNENDYTYRSGSFATEEPVKELIVKLGVTEFVIQFDPKNGYFALYNDPE